MKRNLERLALAEPLTGDGLSFSGYAAVFNQLSEDMGGFRISLRPGAFSRSLKGKRDIRMFLNHEDSIVLASTRAGTLRLTQDDHGLKAEADLPDNEWGRPVADAVARGDIHTMSIGFNSVPAKDEWSDDRSTLFKSEIVLHEVSPITSWAAFPQTTAGVFALAERIDVEGDALGTAIEKLSSGEPMSEEEALLVADAAAELSGASRTEGVRQSFSVIHAHQIALLELRRRVDPYPLNSES